MLELDPLIILLVLVVYSVGVLIYRHYTPKIKGARGEFSVARRLRKLNKNDYKVLNDIYLESSNGKTTQIDHLIISIYGIFVIETKNYQGWIHGHEKSEYWTQSIYHEKRKFRNPVKQNWAHIYFLKEVLSNFKQVKYHSIIVFAGEAELKNVYSTVPVIYKSQLVKTVRQYETPNLSISQVVDIANQVRKCIIKEKREKKKHRKNVRRNIYNRKKNVKALICPNCGGQLVLRKGPYGTFYGCSNYPGCKFSKKKKN